MSGYSTYFQNFAQSAFFIHNGEFLTTNKKGNVDLFSLLECELSESEVRKVDVDGHTEHNSAPRVSFELMGQGAYCLHSTKN